MREISKLITSFAADDSGVTAIEYGLVAALISTVLISFLLSVGNGLTNLFTYTSGCMDSPTDSC